MIEAVPRTVPFEYHTETVQRTVPFEYCTEYHTETQKSHPVPPTQYRTWHNWLLLSGRPYPPQQQLEE